MNIKHQIQCITIQSDNTGLNQVHISLHRLRGDGDINIWLYRPGPPHQI